MPVFMCRLKQDDNRRKLKKGFILMVSTTSSNCNGSDIDNEMERRFGKAGRGLGYPGYWDIKKM